MKEFSCGSIVPGCTAVFHARDDEGILDQVGPHATEDHGITDVPPSLIAEVRRHIRIV